MAPLIDITPGDLTDERTDLIINPTSRDLDFGGLVSAAILKKGSNNIKLSSVNQSNQMKKDGFVIVDAEGLPTRYCMSVDCTPQVDTLAGVLAKALPEMKRRNIDSFSIPAIGAGKQGLKPALAAKFVIESLFKFFHDCRGQLDTIDQVRVIIFENPELLKKFREEFDSQRGSTGRHIQHVGPLQRQPKTPSSSSGAAARDDGASGGRHIRRVGQPGLQFNTVRRSDPAFQDIARQAQQPGHHIVRVRRAAFAEDLATQALNRLNLTARAEAAGAMNADLSGDEDRDGEFQVVLRDEAGVPQYQLDYEQDD